jgi:ABC-type Fe3+/spermidine/putrescine transport system ATPase subunit
MYVTHDQAEAFAIADGIAVMHQGEIEQIDTPEKLYFHPQTKFVAHFLGLTNILPIIRRNGDRVHTAVGDFQPSSEGEAAYILLHPDGLRLASGDGEGITGMVKEYHLLGNSDRLTLQHASGVELVFDVPSFGTGMPEVGAQVQVSVAPEGVIPLRA